MSIHINEPFINCYRAILCGIFVSYFNLHILYIIYILISINMLVQSVTEESYFNTANMILIVKIKNIF